MSVNSSGLNLFAGVEDIEDMFIATMEEMDKEVSNEVSISHPLWEYLQRHNLLEFRASIGTHVPVKLRPYKNNTVKWISGYDDANNTPSKVLKEAKFDYGQLHGVQMYNREELVKNQGPEQLIDLVEEKDAELRDDLNEELANILVGTANSDGKRPMGIGRVVTFDATCGTIDPTAAGMSFWNPQQGLKVGGGSYALATELRAGLRRLDRLTLINGGPGKTKSEKGASGQGRRPDVYVCGEDVYDAMQAWAEGLLQVTIKDIKESSGWGDFEMFTANGRTVIFEPALPTKQLWSLNLRNSIKIRIHRGTYFNYGPWEVMTDKAQAKKRDNLTYLAVYCKSRRANGTMTFT